MKQFFLEEECLIRFNYCKSYQSKLGLYLTIILIIDSAADYFLTY